MAGLMDKLFNSGARNQQPQQQPDRGPGGIPQGTGVAPNGTSSVAPNGTNPTNGQDQNSNTQQQQQENKSPLEEFHKLWEPVTGPDGKPASTTKEPLFNVDPKQVMEAASKTDFKSVATAEELAKVAAGGQDGVAAMMDIMQKLATNVYANAAVAATKIAESGITKALSQAEQRLPQVIRQQQFGDSLVTKNPALQDPAVRPIIESVKAQMTQKYPNATPSELQEMAERYMQAAADAFNPAKQEELRRQQQQAAKENENWDIYFGQQSGGGGFNF